MLDLEGKTLIGAQPPDLAETLITGQNGFISGTQLATSSGWRSVENLHAGDRVLTFDHGMQRLTEVRHDRLVLTDLPLPGGQRPLRIAAGTFLNEAEIWLMPEQGLLIEAENTEDPMGDPFAVVPARALIGQPGISPELPQGVLDITTLSFAQDEVVYLHGGLLAHCLRPRPIDGARKDRIDTDEIYQVLDLHEARLLLSCQMMSGGLGGLTFAADEIAAMGEALRERL